MPKSEVKLSKTAKRFVQYSCDVCRHRRRLWLPKHRRVPRREGAAPGTTAFRTVAQKKQAAANEEAKNAARAAKRQKAKAQAAKAATVDAITQDTTEVEATAVPAVIPLQPVRMPEVTASQGRKRKREDKLSRGMKQLNESGRSSSGFDFWSYSELRISTLNPM